MAVQDTSLIAYFGEVLPNLGNKQREALEAFTKKEEFTNAELAEFLRWPINTVTPRTNELVARGLVTESRKRVCKVTGRTAIAWKIKPRSDAVEFCCHSFRIFQTHAQNCPRTTKNTITETNQATLL